MQCGNRWLTNRAFAAAFAIAVVTVAGGLAAYAIYNMSGTLLVCPGCNPPEMLHMDHYTVQNSTSGPSLLTIWFASTGPAGKSLTVQTLYIYNSQSTHVCNWIPYNESTCHTPFAVGNVKIPALSVVSVTVDTSGQGLYFAAGQSYTIDVVTDQSEFGGFRVDYPVPSLVETNFAIGYDSGQPNPTVLTLTLANMAQAPETLASIMLRDTTSNSSAFTFQMNGPAITQPLGTAQAKLDTLGSGFYFTRYHGYQLIITPNVGPPTDTGFTFQ